MQPVLSYLTCAVCCILLGCLAPADSRVCGDTCQSRRQGVPGSRSKYVSSLISTPAAALPSQQQEGVTRIVATCITAQHSAAALLSPADMRQEQNVQSMGSSSQQDGYNVWNGCFLVTSKLIFLGQRMVPVFGVLACCPAGHSAAKLCHSTLHSCRPWLSRQCCV